MTARQIQVRLGQLARVIERGRATLDAAYAERDQLYEEGVAQGILQLELAEWAGTTAGAVYQTLSKRRRNGS